EHIIIHSYYLWPAAIFAFLLLTRSFLHIKNTKLQAGLLILYGLIGFVQTQHHFHRQAEYQAQKVQKLFSQYEISPQARIAVYVGDGSCSTQYLYWSRHQGWCFYEDQFKGAEFCPEGADYYFRFE